ncbi:hypothetical protein F5Y03DRAFT_410109 [Xylaria venustula]|nr:hypothetical protein F5Y03DRAFT_410109 [Xylaria venustula]
MSYSSSEWPTIPGRRSSPNRETEYQSSYGESTIKLSKRDHQYASLFAVVTNTPGENHPEGYMRTKADVEFERQYEIKARAPWAEPQDFNPPLARLLRVVSYRESKATAPWAKPEDFIPKNRGSAPGHGSPELSPPLGRFDKFHSHRLEREIFRNPRTPPRVPSPLKYGPSPELPGYPPQLLLQERIDQLVNELKSPSTYCSDYSNSEAAPMRRVKAMRDFTRYKRKLLKR